MENKFPSEEYKYGFHDEDVSIYKTSKGLSEDVIRAISLKKELLLSSSI